MQLQFAIGGSSLGAVLVAVGGRGVCAILVGEDPARLAEDLALRFPRCERVRSDEALAPVIARVIDHFERPQVPLDVPLDPGGTAFQQRVWTVLAQIPAGETVTYAQVAAVLGAPGSARAVAQACAANRLAVAIPCHRVVRSDGGLSGYRWGVERKRALLEREAKRS